MDKIIQNSAIMMKPLRKRHLQVWIITTLLLPAGIILAWLAIPNQQPVQLLQTPGVVLLPVIKQTRSFNDHIVNLRTNNNHSDWQLEWKNKAPLKVASAVIYRVPITIVANKSFDPVSSELVGRIEARGDYVFPLSENPVMHASWQFLLYDFIHEKIIDTINFQL